MLTADRSAMAMTDPTCLSVAEAATTMGLSPGHVRRLCGGQWTEQGLA